MFKGIQGLFAQLTPDQVEEGEPQTFEAEVITITDEQQVINSEVIQKDIDATFAQVLKDFELDQSKESNIEELQGKLETFKTENKSIYEKIKQLNTFGFINTPSAKKTLEKLKNKEAKIEKDIEAIEKDIKANKKLQEQIKDYKLVYPMFKFIDDASMIAIMKKYSLVLGETFMYTKEIPDRALGIISGFTKEIKESERVKQIYMDSYGGRMMSYGVQDKPVPVEQEGYDAFDIGVINSLHIPSRYDRSRRVIKEVNVSKLKMIAPLSHFEIPTIEQTDYRGETVTTPIAMLNPSTCKFEISVYKANEVAKKRNEVLDPIACLEVDGGYIILDAWDEEANIPEIKNQMLN